MNRTFSCVCVSNAYIHGSRPLTHAYIRVQINNISLVWGHFCALVLGAPFGATQQSYK